jgi:hypothetical protein
LGELYQLVYKLLGSGAEGQIDALLCAEEIGDTGEVGALDIFEEQGRAGGGDDPAVDLGDFEVGGDRGFDADEFAFAL